MQAWYDLVFQGMAPEHRLEHRYLGPDGNLRPSFHPNRRAALRSAVAARCHHNVYVGMALRRAAAAGEKQRGGKEECSATRVLWCEYDAKHHGNIAAVPLRHLQAFGLPLSIVVFSGGGFHIQLLLADLLDLDQPGMRDRVEAVNRHLAYALGGDVKVDNVGDVPRILRPPASVNFKYDPPRPVELVRLEPDCRYTLEEVERWLRCHSPRPPAPQPQPRHHSSAAETPERDSAASSECTSAFEGETVTPWDAWLAQAAPWQDMLEQDGWRLCKTKGCVEYWTRPGKGVRDGLSASLGFDGPDLLHVFTSSVAGLEQNGTYDRWGYEVALRYNGDFAAAAKAKAEEGFGTLGRWAKKYHGGDLSAAARDLARRNHDAEREERRGDRGHEALDLSTGERVMQRTGLRLSYGRTSSLSIHTTFEKEDLHWSR